MTTNIRLKTLTLLALGCVLVTPVLRADDTAPSTPPADQPHAHKGHGNMLQRRLKQLDEKLHLTDDQKTKITAIYTTLETKLRGIREDDSIAREDKRAKAGEAMKATHDEVRTVLTADQQKIYDTMKPERPPHEKGAPPPADAPPPPPADAPPPPSGNTT